MGSGADGMHKRMDGQQFNRIAQQVGQLVTDKNSAYGDAFAKCGEFLKVLYPNGIPTEKYTDALATVRIFDKLMRIATRKGAFGESAYLDIAGYAILGAAKDEPTAAPAIDGNYHP